MTEPAVWSIVAIAAIVFLCAGGLQISSLARARRRLRRSLEEQGYRIREMELRWFTLGPPEMPAFTHRGGYFVYRISADSPAGQPQVAWIRWRPGGPDGLWQLHWDQSPVPRKRGVSTLVFCLIALVWAALVLTPVLTTFAGSLRRRADVRARPSTQHVAALAVQTPERRGLRATDFAGEQRTVRSRARADGRA